MIYLVGGLGVVIGVVVTAIAFLWFFKGPWFYASRLRLHGPAQIRSGHSDATLFRASILM